MNFKSKVDGGITDADLRLAEAIDKKPVEDRTAAEAAQLAGILARMSAEITFCRAQTDRLKPMNAFLNSERDRNRRKMAALKAANETAKRMLQAPDDDCAHAKGEIALLVGKMKLLMELREGPDRDSLRMPGPGVTVDLQKLIRKAEERLAPLMDDRRTAFAFVQGGFYSEVGNAIDIEIDMEDRRIRKKMLALEKLGDRDAWANAWAHKENLRLSDLKDGVETRNLRRWAKGRGIDVSKCKRNPARKEFSKAFREEFNVSPDTVMRFLKPYIQ